jgi:hypothetical protein
MSRIAFASASPAETGLAAARLIADTTYTHGMGHVPAVVVLEKDAGRR